MEQGSTAAVKKVLVIDDETDLLEMLEFRLRAACFGVETAESGEAGLAMAADFKPDVILLDVAMPGLDGYEVCRRLRADPETADISVVMLTALCVPGTLELGLAAGADAVLFKPYKGQELLEVIRCA